MSLAPAPLHVVFGAGQIGASLARLLVAQGLRVRVARRSDRPVGDGIEVVAGDARDPAFTRRAVDGAAVVYHCMNPSTYSGPAWESEFPAQGEALIAAARAVDARLVCLDNLYAYGPTDTRRTPETPLAAEGRKGRVRVAWDARLRAAGREGLRFVVGRAGDFFGPGTGPHSFIGSTFVDGVVAGKRSWLIGAAEAPHAFSFAPDVVAGLAALGTAPADVEGRVFHLPVLETSPVALVRALADAAGTPGASTALPAWLVRTLGLVVPLFGELGETLYQWDRPFLVDDTPFRTRFPGLATPLAAAAARTVAAARAAHPDQSPVAPPKSAPT